MLILGIESSCDDAAAAVIETARPGVASIRSSVIANQDEIHRRYGGVVPELASRNHVVTILPVIKQALEAADCALNDIGGIAVHIAARVAATAEPDEVLVSSTVRDLVAGSGLRFASRGMHALKGVPEEWHLFLVQ